MLSIIIASFALQSKSICIVIDPGHPSEVGRGTAGKKISEIQAAWQVSQKLKQLLVKDGYRVVMTKETENQLVTNRRRAQIANEAHADLFLRLHCDAAEGSGIAVYFPNRQGKVGRDKGPSKDVLTLSKGVALPFHRALIECLKGKLADRGLMGDTHTAIGSRQGALSGSIYSKVAVLLVEMCVLTNLKDEAFISSKAGQDAVAAALAAGVRAAVPINVGRA